MTREEITDKLKNLAEAEMNNETFKEAKELKAQFDTETAAINQKQLEDFLNESGEKNEFKIKRDKLDEAIENTWVHVKKSHREKQKEEAAQQRVNLTLKREIIEDIEKLAEKEENIKRAFETMKELEEKWKSTGPVPSSDFSALQADFSKARDAFFYNIRIHKELFEHDLKRNLQLKQELVDKMNQLKENPKIKEVDALAKSYLKDWDEIGPTFKEEWEKVRDDFREARFAAFERIKEHYQKVKEQQKENLTKKEAILEKAENILKEDIQTKKHWNKLTDFYKELQTEWRKIGFAPKDKNEEVWKRFKEAGDAFFARKKEFFKDLREVQNKNRDIKQDLLKSADELKESEEWKDTTEKLKQLQNKWTSTGAASQRDEQKLWLRFREACNSFFDRKKEHFAGRKQEEIENLKAKKELIQQINAIEAGNDQKSTLETLESKIEAFNKTGFVPIKNKGEIQNDFRSATQKAYQKLGLSREEITKKQLNHKLDEIKQTGDTRTLEREKRNITDKMKELESVISQYENNMSFFGLSKGAEQLKKEVEEKLDGTRNKYENLKKQLIAIKKTIRETQS